MISEQDSKWGSSRRLVCHTCRLPLLFLLVCFHVGRILRPILYLTTLLCYIYFSQGATLNFCGLSLTSATHGAFLVQLTTLFVPVIQGVMGVPISKRMWTAVILALSGVLLFTQSSDGSGDATLIGDALCVASALFFGLYDLSLNKWGDKVPPVTLIRNKIATQMVLSLGLLLGFGGSEIFDYIKNILLSGELNTNVLAFAAIALGNGLFVNAGASLLQVRAQNAIGATTAQVVYATQPLMAAMLSYFFLNETIGMTGLIGGAMFIGALFLAGKPEENVVVPPEKLVE